MPSFFGKNDDHQEVSSIMISCVTLNLCNTKVPSFSGDNMQLLSYGLDGEFVLYSSEYTVD